MMPPRSFIRPLFLSALAMAVLGSAIYFGLGWAVWSGQPWLEKALGEKRFLRLYAAYAAASESLLPGDRDGDGVSDGLELFLQMNPDDPTDARLAIVLERPGAVVGDVQGYLDIPRGHKSYDTIWLRPGEPMRVRGHTFYDYSSLIPTRAGCAKGLRIKLEPLDTPGLAFPGGKLTVPVNSDGSFEFDLQVPANVVTDPSVQAAIRVRNAATGQELILWNVDYVWPMPPLPATVSKLIVDKGPGGAEWMILKAYTTFQLDWPSVPTAAEDLLLEVSHDEPGAKWFPVRSYPPDQTSRWIYRYADDLLPYKGPLKFRIVPVRYSTPETR